MHVGTCMLVALDEVDLLVRSSVGFSELTCGQSGTKEWVMRMKEFKWDYYAALLHSLLTSS